MTPGWASCMPTQASPGRLSMRLPTRNDWRFDHIFVRGFDLAAGSSAGVVSDVHGASDHKAVWAVVSLGEPEHLAASR